MLVLRLYLLLVLSSGVFCRCRRRKGRSIHNITKHGDDNLTYPYMATTSASNEKYCGANHVAITGETVVWNQSQICGTFSATPHCLSKNRIFELSSCTDGKLHDAIECSSVQHPVSACPPGLREEETFCVKTLEANYEASQCPPGYRVNSVTGSDLKATWLPVRRDLRYGIGEFVYDGVPRNASIIYAGNYIASAIIGYDCLMYHEGTIKSEFCNNTHIRLCKYWMMQHNNHHYCLNLGSECRGSYFNQSILKCLCSRVDCNYAALNHPYQNLINFDVTPSLGLEFDENLKWISTGENVTYTFWANQNLVDFDKDMTIMHTGKGWGVSTTRTDYKLCEVEYNYNIPNITIYLSDNKITLELQNQHSLAMNEDQIVVFCYSDSMAEHLFDIFWTYKYNGESMSFFANGSGYYWCEGYSIDGLKKITSNKILVIMENLFTIEMTVNYTVDDDPTTSSVAYGKFISAFDKLLPTDIGVNFKWMQTIDVNEQTYEARYLVHIVTQLSSTDLDKFDHLSQKLGAISKSDWMKHISELYHPKYCMATSAKQGNKTVTWNMTASETSTTANEKCLNYQGHPISRMCSVDFHRGARWLEPEECYAPTSAESKWTDELSNLTKLDDDEKILNRLAEISVNALDFVLMDIHFASLILKKVSGNESVDLEQIIKIISNIMESNVDILRMSQMSMNATDRILYYFDVIVNNHKRGISGDIFAVPNIILYSIDVSQNDFSGFAITKHLGEYLPRRLLRGVTLEFIYSIPNLEVATFLPVHLLNLIEHSNDTYVSFTFFLKDVLFPEETQDHDVIATNVAVLLPKLKSDAFFRIPMIFNPTMNLARRKRHCGYWKYVDSDLKGHWVLERKPTHSGLKFLLCDYTHTTHFGLVLSNTLLDYSYALDITTSVCCSLSMLGIICIFITAFIFRTKLDNSGNTILVHYSAVTFVQTILIYISFNSQENYEGSTCIFVGALIQYTIMAQMFWMLTIGLFLYKHYIQVLQGPTMWMFKKSCLICYLASAVPVLVLLIFFQETYVEGSMGFCFPSGEALRFGVGLPLGTVLCMNCFIFSIIFFEAFCRTRSTPRIQDDTFFLRLSLVTLLFSLINITWTVALFSQMFRSVNMDFTFGITVSLHGFALFIFFIVLNRNVRAMYVYMWKNRCFTFWKRK